MECVIFVTWRRGVKFLDQKLFLVDLVGCQHLFKYSEHVVKRGCFEKPLWYRESFCFEVKGRYKDLFLKLLLFANLLGGCYLFEILHTASAMNLVKM